MKRLKITLSLFLLIAGSIFLISCSEDLSPAEEVKEEQSTLTALEIAKEFEQIRKENRAYKPSNDMAKNFSKESNTEQAEEEDKQKPDLSKIQPYPGSVFEHRIDMKVNGIIKEGSDEEWWHREESLKDQWEDEWWVLD
jgi:hypothetical protein